MPIRQPSIEVFAHGCDMIEAYVRTRRIGKKESSCRPSSPARLYRIVPLLVILAIIALAIYLVVSWRSTPARAKEDVIKIFMVL